LKQSGYGAIIKFILLFNINAFQRRVPMINIEKIHVPSGSMLCSTSKPAIMYAYLSSCVGVAAFDEVARIGGLCHFLLPSPVSECQPGDEAKYASTGLPMFLETLSDMGASLKRLKVTIAGGAFSGIISHHDINLDIGGRTSETVKNILDERRITIVSSETGGFFTCSLKLDLRNGAVEICPTIPNQSLTDEEIALPSEEEISEAINRIQPIPQIALKILRMIGEDLYTITSLASEVKKEQVISAQVLKYCNSAIFTGKPGIDSIEDAILIMGQDKLAHLVTSIAVKNLFSNHNLGYSLVKGGLYHHAISVATLSEKLAVEHGKHFPFSAYTAGLLHDLGKIALDQFIAETAPMFYRNLQDRSVRMIDLENRSEERRVGKECRRLCRSRWSPYH
jgi:chemotaxis receptor (MCP) glutamine deamidase CheD